MEHNLPSQYREDPWILALSGCINAQIEEQRAQAASIPEQMSLDTVSWNLSVEERIAGIVPSSGSTVEKRRADLRAKWRSSGKATLEQIRTVAESWPGQGVTASFLGGIIRLDVINLEGNADDIRSVVEKIKPAHLPLEILERKYIRTPVYLGAFPRQGDKRIVWEVDCT